MSIITSPLDSLMAPPSAVSPAEAQCDICLTPTTTSMLLFSSTGIASTTAGTADSISTTPYTRPGLSSAETGGVFIGAFFGFILLIILLVLCMRHRSRSGLLYGSRAPSSSMLATDTQQTAYLGWPRPHAASSVLPSDAFAEYNSRVNRLAGDIQELRRKDRRADVYAETPFLPRRLVRRHSIVELPPEQAPAEEHNTSQDGTSSSR
jgi:hypothetical protein